MGFAGAGPADQHDIALLLEGEPLSAIGPRTMASTAGEIADQGLVDRVVHRA